MNACDKVRQIHSGLSVLCEPGFAYEVRVFGEKILSGVYSDLQSVACHLGEILFDKHYRHAKQWKAYYLTCNPVGLPINGTLGIATKTAADCDVVRLKRLFLDFDPPRPANTEATPEAKSQTFLQVIRCKDALEKLGFARPLVAYSGNGFHLVYGIDLENTIENRALIKGLIWKLRLAFPSLDKSTHNPARLIKIYGTPAFKAAWHWSQLVDAPSHLSVVPRELLVKVGGERKRTDATGKALPITLNDPQDWSVLKGMKGDVSSLNLYQLCLDHGLEPVALNSPEEQYEIVCPWHQDHSDGRNTAFCGMFANGFPWFHCFHGHCAEHRTTDFLALFRELDQYCGVPYVPKIN